MKSHLAAGLIGSFLAVLFLNACSPKQEKETQEETLLNPKEFFQGVVVFEASAKGANKPGIELFKNLAATRYELKFKQNLYSQFENLGLNAGRVVANFTTKSCFFLDTAEHTSSPLVMQDVDKYDDVTRSLSPQFYQLELEATTESEVICGYTAKKYLVKKSGSTTSNMVSYAWITEEINFPLSRFIFESRTKRVMAPIPLFVGIDKGAVLKMTVSELKVEITFVATKLQKCDLPDSDFEVPKEYKTITN